MKKVALALFSIALTAGFAACGGGTATEDTADSVDAMVDEVMETIDSTATEVADTVMEKMDSTMMEDEDSTME